MEAKTQSNIAEDKEFIELNIKELDGVPAEIIKDLQKLSSVKGKKGVVKITLDKNKAGAYLATFTNEDTRMKMK